MSVNMHKSSLKKNITSQFRLKNPWSFLDWITLLIAISITSGFLWLGYST